MKRLLIYIPSYNRYELLIKQMTVLTHSIEASQIKNIRIVVSDNASPDERYLGLAKSFPQKYVDITRNRLNIGAVANVIRGFEYGEFDYIWVLSDDDEITHDALRIISEIVGYGQHDFYYLKSNIKGDSAFLDGEILCSQREFLGKFTSLSMMGLISANIYPMRINKYIEYMYLYGYTLFPHLAGVFKLMGKEQFSLQCIGGNLLEWKPNQNSYSHIYEMALTNVLFLAELIENKRNRDIFISKHLSTFGISHFFLFAVNNSYSFKKAWTQVGFGKLFYVGIHYIGWQILRLARFLFPKTYDWYRILKAKKNG